MRELGLFADEEKAWFCTGFIAGVLGDNPKDGPGLVAKMLPMPDKEQAVIIRAIAYSGRPDWRELLEQILAPHAAAPSADRRLLSGSGRR